MSPHWLSTEGVLHARQRPLRQRPPSPKALIESSSGGKEGSILYL